MSDIFEIYGNKGKNTYTSSHPISWGEFNMVDVYHGYGPHIIEVAMESWNKQNVSKDKELTFK